MAQLSGIYIHVLLDSRIYTDIQPFYSSTYDPLLTTRIFAGLGSYIYCIWSFLGAAIMFIIRLILILKKIDNTFFMDAILWFHVCFWFGFSFESADSANFFRDWQCPSELLIQCFWLHFTLPNVCYSTKQKPSVIQENVVFDPFFLPAYIFGFR